MTTKQQYIAQAKADNAKTLYAIINDEQVQLSDVEYEETITAWAEMRVAQGAAAQAAADKAAAAASGRTKLAALGLTDDEINALLGA